MIKRLKIPTAADLLSWRNFDANEVWQKLRTLPSQFKPQPNTGRLWLDVVFLLIICGAQFVILPDVFGRFIFVDLVTVWMVISFVQQSLGRATFLAFVGAMSLETHSSAPAGMYFCAYWIMVNMIHQMRDTLSWRQPTPWMATFVICEVSVILFEFFVSFVLKETLNTDLSFLLVQIARIGLTVGFGMLICTHWLRLFDEITQDAGFNQ